MEKTSSQYRRSASVVATVVLTLVTPIASRAVTTVFFDSSQTTNQVASGATSDTMRSEGYEFTYTRDKLFTGGVGLTNPIGRNVRIPWPDGLEAQAVTAGPHPGGAKITIRREDGEPFALQSFTAKLLANTAGAGASFEIMPKLNGEDGAADPFMYDATGYYGMNFNYNTPELAGFDAYVMTLYVDFAVMSLTMVDASLPPPTLTIAPADPATIQISWPTNAAGYALQFTTNLPATSWSPITNTPVVNGELFMVELPSTGSQRVYRLRK